MFVRVVLVLMAALWLPFGLYYFVWPEALAEIAGVVAVTPTATTEIRAMYGGLEMGIGALALAGLLRPRLAESALIAVVFLIGGLASARLLGAILDGGWSVYTGGGLAFEIVSCGLALVALRRLQSENAEGID